MNLSKLEKNHKRILKKIENCIYKDDYIKIFIEMGEWLDKFPIESGKDTYIMSECQFKVWLYISYFKEKVVIYGDSDSKLVKGIIFAVKELLKDFTRQEIKNIDYDCLNKWIKSSIYNINGQILKSIFMRLKLSAA